MRISRLTDYGIIVLASVARDPARTHNARDLAEETGIPLPTVSKVLKSLTRAGILASHRGVAGGYSLARPAGSVTMTEIIAALEGPIALTLCSEGAGACGLEHSCPSRSHLQVINTAIRGALDNVRLADLAAPAQPLIAIGGGRAPKGGLSQ